MSTDIFLRTIGTLACVYTVGLFVSVMSVSAINGVSAAAAVPCSEAGCHVAFQERRIEHPSVAIADDNILHAAAAFLIPENF